MSLDSWMKPCTFSTSKSCSQPAQLQTQDLFCCDVTAPPGSSFVSWLKELIKGSPAWWFSWLNLFPSQTALLVAAKCWQCISLFTCNSRQCLQTSSAKDQLSGHRSAKSAPCVRGMCAGQRLWLVALVKLERNYHSFLQFLRNAGVWTEGSLWSTQNMNVRNLFFQNP